MNTIIITGATCTGKTILSNKLGKLFRESLIIKTDSYYKDDKCIKLLSKLNYDIYDRLISIKRKELLDTINSLYNRENNAIFYNYDFRSKNSSKLSKQIKYQKNSFIIIEGVFAHRLNLDYSKTINIVCIEKKDICYKRRLQRDKLERGRTTNEVNKKFIKSWSLYYKNIVEYIRDNKIIYINTNEKESYKNLIKIVHEKINKKN